MAEVAACPESLAPSSVGVRARMFVGPWVETEVWRIR
jgi:hypothetical protein